MKQIHLKDLPFSTFIYHRDLNHYALLILGLQSEALRSNLTWGNILLLEFFSLYSVESTELPSFRETLNDQN